MLCIKFISLLLDAENSLAPYAALWKIKCSKNIELFLCSVFNPICAPALKCKNLFFTFRKKSYSIFTLKYVFT